MVWSFILTLVGLQTLKKNCIGIFVENIPGYNPKSSEVAALVAKSFGYQRTKSFAKAIKNMEKALKVEPKNCDVRGSFLSHIGCSFEN